MNLKVDSIILILVHPEAVEGNTFTRFKMSVIYPVWLRGWPLFPPPIRTRLPPQEEARLSSIISQMKYFHHSSHPYLRQRRRARFDPASLLLPGGTDRVGAELPVAFTGRPRAPPHWLGLLFKTIKWRRPCLRSVVSLLCCFNVSSPPLSSFPLPVLVTLPALLWRARAVCLPLSAQTSHQNRRTLIVRMKQSPIVGAELKISVLIWKGTNKYSFPTEWSGVAACARVCTDHNLWPSSMAFGCCATRIDDFIS